MLPGAGEVDELHIDELDAVVNVEVGQGVQEFVSPEPVVPVIRCTFL